MILPTFFYLACWFNEDIDYNKRLELSQLQFKLTSQFQYHFHSISFQFHFIFQYLFHLLLCFNYFFWEIISLSLQDKQLQILGTLHDLRYNNICAVNIFLSKLSISSITQINASILKKLPKWNMKKSSFRKIVHVFI